MHGLGLEHEFRLIDKEGESYMYEIDIHSLMVEMLYTTNKKAVMEHLPGAWILETNKLEPPTGNVNKNKWVKNITKNLFKYGLKLVYFYILFNKIHINDHNKIYVAYVNGNPVDLKYLYIFNMKAKIPAWHEIVLTLDDFDLLNSPDLEIVSYRIKKLANGTKLDHIPIDGGIVVSYDAYATMPNNPETGTIFTLYDLMQEDFPIDGSNSDVETTLLLLDLYSEDVLEDEEQGLIEIKNINFRDVTIDEVLEVHRSVIDVLTTSVRYISDVDVEVPGQQYIEDYDEELYTGSYHVWFTLPPTDVVPDRNMANYHAVSLLQWLEPLLFTSKLSDIDGPCKSTYRMCGNNVYGGFGSTNPELLKSKTMTYWEAYNDAEYRKMFHYYREEQLNVERSWFDKVIKGPDGQDFPFTSDAGRYQMVLFQEGYTYFDYIEEFSGEKMDMKMIGNDIRSIPNSRNLSVEVDKGELYVQNISIGPGGNTSMSEDDKVDAMWYAFEVRIFDNAPLDVMGDKMRAMVLIFYHAITSQFDEGWCFHSQVWQKAMAESLYYGSSHTLSSSYMTMINTFCDVDIDIALSIDDYWSNLVDILHDRYHSEPFVKRFFG